MLRSFLQRLLRKPVARLADRISSAPKKEQVFASLGKLLDDIVKGDEKTGLLLPFDIDKGRIIILSDQHKGTRDEADDFRLAEQNYLQALHYYDERNFIFVNLGDCEELWENTPDNVMKTNKAVLEKEAAFLEQKRYYRIFGNHDLEWKYPLQQTLYLDKVFGKALQVYEGLVLQMQYNNKTWQVFLTHGHQGDQRSDGNAFSKWVVAAIWTPIQRYLEVSTNSLSDSFGLVDTHNIIMHEWSATRPQMLLVAGHTHKPVFASLDHIDRLTHQLEAARLANNTALADKTQKELEARQREYAGKQFVKSDALPSYFNSGCCCFDDGDITGIELEDGYIRLIKWETSDNGQINRIVLEESSLQYIFDHLETGQPPA
ncbi:MAG: metallophosphoesterase [Bacteroidetes bacterium]|nr:metallophosphoesterase [Bacteroidota bacterium]